VVEAAETKNHSGKKNYNQHRQKTKQYVELEFNVSYVGRLTS
jgi:hypothetical protein